ncbi:unnamed protein product [Eruca vesicaria subsp. sativa]|uniref:Uncharacterized protein n=1 Tax=Eruca vesicaria subsp. sativa TaxID=29727 RepID=A0ABC8LF64_ERUVS|nr:unnamed protein product [Eruca vesicaria subsp. sativa]
MDESDGRKIRNICILAHVDHGKTTLADHLIASSRDGELLHPRLVGKLRYMDYLDEEQRRAIIMKSFPISFRYKDYSLNLIDSPGYMDFCIEVSTAARLSDGALVLVDAVEGVQIQTHAVLRQACIEKLTPCLVLNKIDRLICELRVSPMEAYTRLIRIVHEVNRIVSAYKSDKYLPDVDSILVSPSGEITDESLLLLEDDEDVTFQPQKGNVVFVSALDGWGCGISEFATFHAPKLGAKADTLQRSLWGPHYYVPKINMIAGKKSLSPGSKAKPMFVKFVLEPLWQVYKAALDPDGDRAVLENIIESFNSSIPPRELQNKDPKNVPQSVMSRWLPLPDAVLSMAVTHLPDPVTAQAYRIPCLVPESKVIGGHDVDSSVLAEAELVRKSIEACDSTRESPCVVFVSKMFVMPMKMIPQGGDHGERMNSLNDEDSRSESDECFLAFARIFSGVLCAGQRIFVISAQYDPLKGDSSQKYIQEAELHSIYLMMGQGLTPVNEVKAGDVVAIRGLGPYISKSATLSSTRNCWPLASMEFQVSPALRVAIEPSDPADKSALVKGLHLLIKADPFAEISLSARGEYVLAVSGEVHLERCIKDLKDRYAKVNIEVSSPLMSYGETTEDWDPKRWEWDSHRFEAKPVDAEANVGSGEVITYPSCQVDNCMGDLSVAKDYNRRHNVCEVHSKATEALVGNQKHRFCQQCNRFHLLSQFDKGKKSCRRGLEYKRRRRIKLKNSTSKVVAQGSSDNKDNSDMTKLTSSDDATTTNLEKRTLEFPSFVGGEISSSSQPSPSQDSYPYAQDTGSNILSLQQFTSSPTIASSGKYYSSASRNPVEDRSPSSSPVTLDLLPMQTPPETMRSNNGKSSSPRNSCLPRELFCASNGGAAENTSYASVYSPPGLNFDAQDRTGKIVFKLFEKDPSHLPGTLRTELYSWLSSIPSELESYIRPCCVILSVYMAMPSYAREQFEKILLHRVRSLVQDSEFWSNTNFLVNTGRRLASYKHGRIRLGKSLRTLSSLEMITVSPVAVVSVEETTLVVRGKSLNNGGTSFLCTYMGKYMSMEVTETVSRSTTFDELTVYRFKVKGPCLGYLGSCFVEVEYGLRSDSFPLIIASATICKELN